VEGRHLDLTAIINSVCDNALIWVFVMFVGVLYWGFRPSIRRRLGKDKPPDLS
jgi:cbb3-type cytochrome oxidase subunit 3